MIVSIIGGTSGFGKWLAGFIKKNFPDVEIIVTGRNKIKGETVSKELNVKFTTDNVEATQMADVLIFSTPISIIEKTIKELAPYVKEGAIIADVCSIKEIPYKTMKQYAPKNAVIIPVHPMFGPYVTSIADQVFVLTADEKDKSSKAYKWLKQFLKDKNAKVIETSVSHHDKMMAVVQGLTHISMFVIGETIARLGVDVKKSLGFVSPIYKVLIASVSRYVGQDPKLYGDIQMYNPYVLSVHNKMMEVIADFHEAVKNHDEVSFVDIISHTKEFFGEDITSFGQKYTDKIIYLLSKQKEKLAQKLGQEVELTNIYTEEKIKGKLEKLDEDFVVIDGEKISLLDYVY